ncbi:MAG TPA: hypothetical protein DEF51_00195 [Myxococcales bacterium]|nr:hypothetical protein [Myxococcales bacterium]
MIITPEGRWPPVYDAEDLARTIRELVRAEDMEARFWSLRSLDDDACQGDVIRLEAPLPHLDEEGAAVATENDFQYWLVIGNTCDFARALDDVRWTQVVPLVDLGEDVDEGALANLRSYQAAKKFYLPPWPRGASHHTADLLRPATLDKRALEKAARVVARLDYPAWVLLHSCLVRFLCRDDGRYD